MAAELQKLGEQGASFWKGLPMRRRVVLILSAVLLLGLVGYLATRPREEKQAVLFAGLDAQDAGKVLEQLRAENVPFKLTANGSVVEVPEAKVHELRIAMGSKGLPSGGGIGFEVFDQQSLGTTSFVEKINYQRALSGELARTIMSLDAVERARVHLALRERSLFRDEDEPPTASVVVHLRPGRELSPAQVKGIVHLVSSSVERLHPDRVSVVAEDGRVLWSGEQHALASETQHELERTLQRRVSDITDRVVGKGHSVVVVTSELDTAEHERLEELYDKDKYAMRSESTAREQVSAEEGGQGGIAGARGNLPGAPAPESDLKATGPAGRMRQSETRNFEVNKIVNRTKGPKAQLSKLHVAILLDGLPAITSSTGVILTPSLPRPPEELERVATLAREAAGLDAARGDKIEVQSIPFFDPKEAASTATPEGTPPFWERLPKELLFAAPIVLLLAIGSMFVMLMRLKRKRRARVIETLPPLPMTAGEIEAVMSGEKFTMAAAQIEANIPPSSRRDAVIEAARSDSAKAARVLTAWIQEPAAKRVRGGAL